MARDLSASSNVRWSRLSTLFRLLVWGSLLGVTGLLVRGEIQRAEQLDGVETLANIVYRKVGGRQERLDLYRPLAKPPARGRPAVIAIHGGGWRGGSKGSYGRMAARLAQYGYVVVSVEYQLSRPGAPSWPANFEDLREAVRWVRRHAPEYDVDPNRIAALGASAGGHLAALLGTYPDGPVLTEGMPENTLRISSAADSARVQAVIDFYGPMDLLALTVSRPEAVGPIALYLGGTPGEVPRRYEAASPIRHVSSDDPPMLLIHGTDDALVPLEQARAMLAALQEAGVGHRLIVVDKARHGFEFQVEGRDLLPEILAFLDESWKSTDHLHPSAHE